MSDYPYSRGDRLEDRNTYFYSEYGGQAFLTAWDASRSAALALLPAPVPVGVPIVVPASALREAGGYETALLLGYLLNCETDALSDKLLQRFEVSKRLYRRYDRDFKAVRDSGYDDLDLYIKLGALCVQRRSRPAALRFLNALLKVLDSLISVQERLSSAQGAHAAWLILAERAWVEDVAARAGVQVTT